MGGTAVRCGSALNIPQAAARNPNPAAAVGNTINVTCSRCGKVHQAAASMAGTQARRGCGAVWLWHGNLDTESKRGGRVSRSEQDPSAMHRLRQAPSDRRFGRRSGVVEETGEVKSFVLCYPESAGATSGDLSVLDPIGCAVLGCGVGHEIVAEDASGMRRLRLVEVLY